MGLFDNDDDYRRQEEAWKTVEYARLHPEQHKAKLSHELIAGAASFAAAKMYEDKLEKEGKPVNHKVAKELLAGFAGAYIDRVFETKGLDALDHHKAKQIYKDKHLHDTGRDATRGRRRPNTPNTSRARGTSTSPGTCTRRRSRRRSSRRRAARTWRRRPRGTTTTTGSSATARSGGRKGGRRGGRKGWSAVAGSARASSAGTSRSRRTSNSRTRGSTSSRTPASSSSSRIPARGTSSRRTPARGTRARSTRAGIERHDRCLYMTESVSV
ncbi:hypothetical protein DFH07DRAFT_144576 [Mycena maculata]|uniref:CipC-like antibiotic response protein n=1 Tax=Mycena maculata TaxID=230809 RepID=A0AAD7I067_9AGAR|nr:hypothetical protein DFH07DRAFT_144576 [Mycena maculata]